MQKSIMENLAGLPYLKLNKSWIVDLACMRTNIDSQYQADLKQIKNVQK
jgi:hypothetical protein